MCKNVLRGWTESEADMRRSSSVGIVYYRAVQRALFSTPLGRSRMTIILLPLGPLGPGLRVRLPFVCHPQIDRGCLLDFDLPRPPPWG